MKHLFLAIALLILCYVPMGRLSAQAPPTDSVRGLVQAYLNAQIGREGALVEYTFVGVTFQDASLGCPQPDQTYAQVQTAGYRWTFLLDDGIRYSLNSDIFGTQIVFCPQTSQTAFVYSTYRGAGFSITHPNLWTARQVSPSEVAFNFRGQVACNLPEMRVLLLSNYASPRAILEAYFANSALTLDPAQVALLGAAGETVTYARTCETMNRTTRLSALMGTGGASYLIVQSAPTVVFPIWEAPFQAMRDSFIGQATSLSGAGVALGDVQPLPSATFAPTPTGVAGVSAPATPPPPPNVPAPPPAPPIDLNRVALVHVFVGDLYVGGLNNLPGLPITGDGSDAWSGLTTSSDGLQVAFLQDGTQLATLSLTMPTSPNILAEDVAFGLPPSWALDQAALAYLAETGAVDESGAALLDLRQIFPDGRRETLGQVPFIANCSPPPSNQLDRLTAQERELTFAWLPDGRFLFSSACDGTGLSLYDPASATLQAVGESLRGAALAPRRDKVAAFNETGLFLVTLADLTAERLTTQAAPDALAWDVTGTQLYYSSLTPNEDLTLDDPSLEAQARAFLGEFPYTARLNAIRLFQIDVVKRVEAQLWEGLGFRVGRLGGLPDGSGVLFSLIPSDRNVLTLLINGGTRRQTLNALPETELYFLAVNLADPTTAPRPRLLAVTSRAVLGVPR